ncbi:MAG: hypothetical protein M1823_001245 [Watsoniomyces obsoletus]|nr:MAG: hypothetical protein M1823_001245 [Watsoniomyces obsoletus]
MSTQRPARRRSARLAFGSEEGTTGSSMENGPSQVKRMKKDEDSNNHTTSGTERPQRRKRTVATYDEEDGGFRFTRTRSKKKTTITPNVPLIPEAVPEEEEEEHGDQVIRETKKPDVVKNHVNREETKQDVFETDEARPRRRRSARTAAAAASAAEEDSKRPSERRPPPPPPPPSKPNKTNIPKERRDQQQQHQEDVVVTVDDTQKIALPFSDTPVIKRNKEFRQQHSKKGGHHRRSSTGWRGRRASSLIENGSDALPHPDVLVEEYYKHIESEGLSEPRRMKQLLTWCGARALDDHSLEASEKETSGIAANVLKDLLRAFSKRSEMSDWFSREIPPTVEVVKKPNPRNAASLAKIEELEQRVKRLQEERKTWEDFAKHPMRSLLALHQPTSTSEAAPSTEPAPASGFPPPDSHTPSKPPTSPSTDVPQSSNLLPLSSENDILHITNTRLQSLTDSLEFTIDMFAEGVHRVSQYHATAERVGARILSSAATRLEEREQAVLTRAGTKEVPMQEVLRSLAAIER